MLEVHEEESPGETMKTGMELVNKLHVDKTAAFNYSGEGADDLAYRAFDAGMAHAADLLQAWLREADEWAREDEGERDCTGSIWIEAICEELLGTTQKPKQEGE